MIGDTFETDILGANRSGIDSALVLTGNSVKLHDQKKLINDKLKALTIHARNIGIMPTFVTKIANENDANSW